ncbi:MAG: hypothetical protein EPO52_06025 [Herbiconiux sp.]|uniref:Ig-like domain-containing protein n=1 Tax=Herbiconiux sp. TaxID=1871186 RepID=UPI0011FCC356|nr:Ig-like domain-containing protein [Herbiconiux sp.]TAJ48920.1 MAG: hypothetical protein EPO52_06025 [Herbiconiux sp.]
MKHTSFPAPSSARARIGLLAAALALASAFVVGLAPAPSASALTIDCSYTPGLKSYLDDGKIPGLRCNGGTAATGSGTSTGTGSGTTTGGTSGGAGTPCTPSTNTLPPAFFANVALNDVSTWSSDQHAGGWSVGVRRNYIDSKLHSELSIYRIPNGTQINYKLVYRLWDGDTYSVATYSSTQPCGSAFSFTSTTGGGPVAPQLLVGPGLPMTPAAGQLETHASLSAVPGALESYLLRLDVTNPTSSTTTTPAFVSLDFGGPIALTSIASFPSGTECDIFGSATEECTVPDVAPGQTKTLIFAVHASSALTSASHLSVLVSNLGYDRMTFRDFAGNERTTTTRVPVTNFYTIAAPAPYLAPPACTLAGSAGSTPHPAAVPSTQTQSVLTGATTVLDTFCTTAAGKPMRASALHGTATIDTHGAISYSPLAGYLGTDTISVVTSDPSWDSESVPTTFGITVEPAAVASDDSFSVGLDGSLTADVGLLANDSVPTVGPWLIQQGATPPAHGTLTLDTVTGTFTYTPAAGYVGADSFLYRLSGPLGTFSNVATVTVRVGAS